MFATIFMRLSTRLRMDLGLGRWIFMVLRQHSRIDLSLLHHQSTSEKKHGRLLKRGSGHCRTFSAVSVTYNFAMDTAGPFSSCMQCLKAPEERQRRLQDPSLQAWETGTSPVGQTFSTGCVFKDQSDMSFMHIHCVFSWSA